MRILSGEEMTEVRGGVTVGVADVRVVGSPPVTTPVQVYASDGTHTVYMNVDSGSDFMAVLQ